MFAAITALYAARSGNGFLYDDHSLVLRQPERSGGDLARALALQFVARDPAWPQLPYYRPLPRASYLVQKALHGDDPRPFHLFNAALTGLAAALLFSVLMRPAFAVPPALAALAALAFGAHPIASEGALAISARETLLPVAFSLAAASAFFRPTRAARGLALAFTAGALLSKELAIVLPAIFAVADALRLGPGAPLVGARAWLRAHAPFAVLLASYAGVRELLFGGVGQHRLALFDAPLRPLASVLYTLQTTFAPFRELVYEPPLEVWLSPARIWLALALVLALVSAAARAEPDVRARALFFGAWFALGIVPVANVLAQEVEYAERYGLFPLAGATGVLAVLAAPVWRGRARLVLAGACVAAIAALAAVSFERGAAYRDDDAFLTQWLRTNPESAQAHISLGELHFRAGRLDAAERHLREGSRLAPGLGLPHWYLGRVAGQRGDLAAAEAHFRDALAANPQLAEAHLFLGRLYLQRGEPALAIGALERAQALQPDLAGVRENLARARAARPAPGAGP